MNREIKFRAWDINNKIIIPFDRMYVCDEYSSISFISSNEDYSGICALPNHNYEEDVNKRFILMQYTGLKDKNGKDIYEGDIVRRHDDDNDISEVTWENALNFSFNYYDMSDDYEIIGNIFENPELLENF